MSLARFTSADAVEARPAPLERCELCAAAIGEIHSHVIDVRDHRIACTCRPCYLLFTAPGAAQGRYKAIPARYLSFSDGTLTGAQWDALQIPIDLAFFFYSTPAGKIVAFYPSPAGATESLLPLGAWDDFVAQAPALNGMEADVEGLLVRRSRDAVVRAYLVPIDVCYQLVGLIRTTWKGFDGGDEAHGRIDDFFAGIEAQSRPPAAEAIQS